MSRTLLSQAPAIVAVLAATAAFPFFADGFYLALGVSVMSYVVLATAWALFSGPTRYVSLATAAFFGIGAYTVGALWETLPWPLVLVAAALIGVAVALVIGLSTLRLSGVFFVIFTFGLAELTRQVVTWYEVNITRTVGRYIFLDMTQQAIYWQLLGLAVLVFLAGWLIGRSRLGLALKVIGDDEIVARHIAINTTAAKLALFAISAGFMSVTGAIMAPRWTYIDPAIAFNPLLSFQVVIMALLGGAGRLIGPLLGAVPLVLIFEFVSANFPNHFSILIGLVFIVIVYFLPDGVIGVIAPLHRGSARMPQRRAELPADAFAGGDALANGDALAAGEALLELSGVSKAFGGLQAVDDVSLSLARGEIVGLIGPNGSGKTTALNLISGALKADRGEIRFKGKAITNLPSHKIARLGIARTFQLVRALGSLSCRDNVIAGLAFRNEPLWGEKARARADALLDRVGLSARAEALAGELTYIDQKRLELARALALDPELLLLDEWLAGLNPTELGIGIELVRSLRRGGLTIVLVEHVMDAIRSLCDRCVVMTAGRTIADGTPAAVLAERNVIAAYLGETADA